MPAILAGRDDRAAAGRRANQRCGRADHYESAPGELTMNNFVDVFEIPTEADVDECYGSKYLAATEVKKRKIKTKIARVRKAPLQQKGGTTRSKLILDFTTLDKEMVLNATNINTLIAALGKDPSGWIGAEVGIHTEATMYGGKPTMGLRLQVLNKPAATPAPKTIPPQPAPKLAATDEVPWPDQPDDPGPDFIDAE